MVRTQGPPAVSTHSWPSPRFTCRTELFVARSDSTSDRIAASTSGSRLLLLLGAEAGVAQVNRSTAAYPNSGQVWTVRCEDESSSIPVAPWPSKLWKASCSTLSPPATDCAARGARAHNTTATRYAAVSTTCTQPHASRACHTQRGRPSRAEPRCRIDYRYRCRIGYHTAAPYRCLQGHAELRLAVQSVGVGAPELEDGVVT
jgi:hypothetical protein